MAQTYTSLLTDVDVDPVNREGLDNTNAPSASHALATADHEEKGAVQLEGNNHYCNLNGAISNGDVNEAIPDPLVGGVSNEDLWTLMRRFDKQIQHVRVTHTFLTGDLDLNVSKDEAFSPDRLRGNVERLYMTVIIGLMTFVKHIARLRSWEEKKRTAAFCITYFSAWAFDLLMPLIVSTLILLIAYAPARRFLFPPVSLATTNAASGGSKEPSSGSLASHSMTGAPEAQPGEAVEQEAHNFVSGFGAIAISSAAGKPHNDLDEGKNIPDPTNAAIKAADVKDNVEGGEGVAKKATKKPMEEAMWENARPFMQYIGTAADTWERFANALSPTAPFPQRTKYKLAAVLLPVLLSSLIITPYILVKAATFFMGVAFYSQPYITKGFNYLNKNYPNWQEAISIQNTLLKAVPTNAQLTLTLLRIGEVNNAPLPPPTTSISKLKHAEAVHEMNEEKNAENQPEYHPDHPSQQKNHEKSKFPQKALSALKQTVKAGVQTALHTDHAKAKIANSMAAKNRLGAVAEAEKVNEAPKGPKEFAARFKGIKGAAVILDSINAEGAPGPVLQWSSADRKQVWYIPVEDIVEVEKLGGFGWKGKMVVGWSLDKQVVDAVRLVYKTPVREEGTGKLLGERLHEEKLLTALVGREELVNRLLSIGRQR